MPKLTDALIKALPAPERNAKITYDDQVTGFGIRITPAGAKTFMLRYRNAQGVERKMRIGEWGENGAWKVTAARARAAELVRTQVNVGADPLAQREAVRAAATVNDVLDAYLKSARYAEKAESTRLTDQGRIDRHLRPLLGKRVVSALRLDDVERAYADIRDGKTAAVAKTKKRGKSIVKGGEGAGRKSIRLLSAALSWAVRDGMIDTNPAAGAQVGSDGQRDAVVGATGYAAMFNALDAMQADGTLDAMPADAIRVIALTGARRGEIAGLKTAHVDLQRGVIALPPSAHKTGRSTNQVRVIGLPKAAVDIIKRNIVGDHVFPIEPDRLSKLWRQVRAKSELQANFGLHGLRHSLASNLAMGGAQAAEIMVALGHKRMATAQRYVHMAEDGRAGIAERAAATALGAMKQPKQ